MSVIANHLPPAGFLTDARTNVTEPPTPLLRGVLHLVAAFFAPVGLVVLLLAVDSPGRYVAAAIFASSLILLYSTSASYHIAPWPGRRWRSSALESKDLPNSTLFVADQGALDAWFNGDPIGSRELLRAVDEEGFGRFWAMLSKHAHPTLEAMSAYSRAEADGWVFDPSRSVSAEDLQTALDAVAALIER